LIQGEFSEKLIEVYALHSFFALQAKKPDEVSVYQKRSTKLALDAFGENN